VVAAAQLFADRGLTVPLEDVARAADVGVATLYRRFPTRAELAIAVFERNISSYMSVVDRALADQRPWESFRELVVELCALQASDPGLRAILTTAFPPSSQIERQTAQIVEKVGEVMVRAQVDGSLRADLAVGDVVVMVLANAGVVEATREHAPNAWRRFAALMVDAFRVGEHPELPAPIPPEQLRRSVAMLTGENTAQT
jgi:AcrR family transcriptional regulator